jgi:NADPH:quinone reductase-like Zn-dependent oxidoreductase
MKAAIYITGEAPKYGDFADPIAENEDQVLITVRAAAVKNLDKGKVSGQHYSSSGDKQAKVAGMDGVGQLADGTRVYGMGITGMIAEKALIDKNKMVKLPAGVDDITAAALPNAVMGAGAALRYRAGAKAGDVVLINGATGVTGMMAVQLAKHFGAKKVIVTGRNASSLAKLLTLGADEAISLKQDGEAIVKRLKEINSESPFDIVIDYLWGYPAELILSIFQGKGGITHKVKYVIVGGMAGDKIQVSSGMLRSFDLEICGSGLGSLPPDAFQKLFTELIPEVFELAAKGKIVIDTVTANLKDVETAWNREIEGGKRLVIVI